MYQFCADIDCQRALALGQHAQGVDLDLGDGGMIDGQLRQVESELEANLDYQVAAQADGGAWEPNWTWAGIYPDAWELARREWCGHLTLETLTTLRAFGRIEA